MSRDDVESEGGTKKDGRGEGVCEEGCLQEI